MQKIVYPAAARTGAAYTLHNVSIPDPYSWLENPDAPDTQSFVAEQNKLFRSQFPEDSKLRQNLKAAISRTFYPRTSAPFPHGDYIYYYHNTGLENQSKYLRTKALKITDEGKLINNNNDNNNNKEDEEIFLDPNTLSADGTTAIRSAAWSEHDKYFAYALSEKGSDWCSIVVRDPTTREDLKDRVEWVKFSPIAWLGDVGFFYQRFPALAEGKEKGAETDEALNGTVYYHKLGTEQSEDVKVVAIPEHPRYHLSPTVSDCNKYLIITVSDGCEPKNLVWITALPEEFAQSPAQHVEKLQFWKVVNEWKGEYNFIGNDDTVFYFSTTEAAPKRKVVALTIPSGETTDIVPEKDSVLTSVDLCKDTLLLVYLEHVKDVLYTRKLKGSADNATAAVSTEKKVELPIGSIASISCRRYKPFISLKITSFVLPGRSYTMDVDTLQLHKYRDDEVEGLVPDDYTTTQVFVKATTDGTEIPMFIVHRKDLDLSTPVPTLLYGYGGFNISLTPSFSPSRIVFMNHLRGVYAVANIRGGGEYGEAWHDAGRKTHKMNCFTDFISCAKYLNAQTYCKPATLAIMGGSNGGLLTAACANIAPEQFSAVVTQVGVLDMYKFHKFTIGHAWRSDYGDPDVAEDFSVLQQYSPLHNISVGKRYPAILVVTGDHDDRVVPLHSLKYIATLQHMATSSSSNENTENNNAENNNNNNDNSCGGPFLARIEVAAGHGAGKPTSKVIDETADTYTFLASRLHAQWRD